MRKPMACLLAASVLAAGTIALAQEIRPTASSDAECTPPDGWQDVADREPLYVVFGELHGTRQGPEFVGTLACALASRGERVLLAIEHSARDNAALQAAWNMPVGRFEAALAETGWAGRSDGVASEAMFAMLVRAHGLKERGLPISVVAFNGVRDQGQATRFADLPGQGPHEAAQAENIADATSSGKYDRVLVLVGSFHARRDAIKRGDIVFDPMARRLARSGPTISLEMRYGPGNSWNCLLKPGIRPVLGQPLPAGALDCANHPSRGNAAFDQPPFIEVAPSPRLGVDGEFDGFFWVGPISGSPPLLAGR